MNNIEKTTFALLMSIGFVSADTPPLWDESLKEWISLESLKEWISLIVGESIVPLLIIGILTLIFWILKQIRKHYSEE